MTLHASAVSQSAKAVSQVVKQVAKSKYVTAATATIERAVKAGGNRVAELGRSAATVTSNASKLAISHVKSIAKSYKDYRSANAYASNLYSIGGKQSGAARLAYTKILRVGNQYVPEIRNFGTHLGKLGKDAIGKTKPAVGAMDDPHAHHMVFKGNFFHRPAMRKALLRSRAVMEKHGLNWYSGRENLVWAPNKAGQHTTANAKAVADILEAADVRGKKAVVKALRRIGKEMSELKFNDG